jgi:hypothetical protein
MREGGPSSMAMGILGASAETRGLLLLPRLLWFWEEDAAKRGRAIGALREAQFGVEIGVEKITGCLSMLL